jgi:phage terminase large subunit GpA-like protein
MRVAYADARAVTAGVAELLRPGKNLRPSAAAAAYLRNDRGPWDPALSPMMVEPLDLLASRKYTGIVFVGPSRSSKTFSLVHGGLTWIVTCAPGDMLVTQMSQEAARDFSRNEVDRVIRYSPELAARLSPRARDDNTHDKFFRNGMSLKLGWPAISQLSSKTLRYVLITDYDRPENRDDVDGEGPIWDLAVKRVQTYMSRGKCVAESSPSEELSLAAATWRATTPHEAPPVAGILALYNRGTRARWYWPCVHCAAWFQAEPGLAPFNLPPFDELAAMLKDENPLALAARYARVACPKCGVLHEMSDRVGMNARGVWLHEGERFEGNAIVGERRESQIASFWLGGVAATYQRWDSMLAKYFQAVTEYEATGEESSLKGSVSMDFGAPHLPRAYAARRSAERLLERAEDYERGIIPAWARFLTAAVDVQAHAFAVGVMAWGPGLEVVWVDRFDITSSKRPEGDRTAAIDPGSYVEDWRVLEDEVLKLSYPVEAIEGFTLSPRLVLCDSGGREGVTTRAYDYWRELKRKGMGIRFRLVKGDGRPNIPRTQETFPDTRGRSDRHAQARGDVPVFVLNVNVLKDGVAKDLERAERGPGYVHLPAWGGSEFFRGLTAETRGPKGWEGKRGVRNESWDLQVYNRAAAIILGAERINWSNPPPWAAPAAEQALAGRVAGGQTGRAARIAALARELNG